MLTLIKTLEEKRGNKQLGLYKCSECDKEKKMIVYRVKTGKSKTCGCGVGKSAKERFTKHGCRKTNSVEYRTWCSIKRRCYNEKTKDYPYYGGKGIEICDRWKNNFQNFLDDMGLKPSPELSIERKNNKIDYCPENCYWGTQEEQKNNMTSNIKVLVDGIERNLKQWSKYLNVPYLHMYTQYKKGKEIKEIYFNYLSKSKNKYAKRLDLEATSHYLYENNLVNGSVYEFGTYLGNGLDYLVNILKRYQYEIGKIFSIDAFRGLPKESENIELFSKFVEGNYSLLFDPTDYIKNKIDYNNIHFINKWFNELNNNDIENYKLDVAKLIIIDCDIYQSTMDALTFMMNNNFVKAGTLILYNEFWSCDDYNNSGECKAHNEIVYKYSIECEEVWHYIYKDKDNGQKIRQSLWEVIRI